MKDFFSRVAKTLKKFFCVDFPRGFRARWYYLLIVLGAVGIDQLTKYLVSSQMRLYQSIPLIPKVLSLTYITNDGAAWGMLDEHRWVFMLFSTVGIIAFVLYLFGKKNGDLLIDLGLALVIGGGVGNMIDRVASGEVVDFIHATFLDPIGGFPIFNGADCFVCVGAAILLFGLVRQMIREGREAKQKEQGSEHETHGGE